MAVKRERGNEHKRVRHFGRDAEIQAMDGNVSVEQLLDSFGFAPEFNVFVKHFRKSL